MCVVTFDWDKNDASNKFDTFRKNKSFSWAIVEITERCNFNCKWCYLTGNASRKEMSWGQLSKMINILADNGVSQITLSGGEPTLHPNLEDAIRLAKSRGMAIHLNTNAFLLNREKLERLKKLGVTQVETNIDSMLPEKHDWIRGVKGAHAHTSKLVKDIKELGITFVVTTVLTKENENEVLDIVRFARSHNIPRYRLWDMSFANERVKEQEALIPTDFLETLRAVSEYARETGAKNVESGDPLFPHTIDIGFPHTGGFCVALAGMVYVVSVEGDVYVCCAGRDKLYNLFEAAEKAPNLKAYHKQKLAKYRSALKLPEVCRPCSLRDKCKGGCLVRSNYNSGKGDYFCGKVRAEEKKLAENKLIL